MRRPSPAHCLLASLLICTCLGFFTQLQGTKCYQTTTFAHENILIHIMLPVLPPSTRIYVDVVENNKVIFTKQLMKSDDKIMVSLDGGAPQVGDIEESEVCVRREGAQGDGEGLAWVSVAGNFGSKSYDDLPKDYETEDHHYEKSEVILKMIGQKIQQIQEKYKEQIDLFRRNQQQQTHNQEYLRKSLTNSYTLTLLQTLIIVLNSAAYVYILRKYL